MHRTTTSNSRGDNVTSVTNVLPAKMRIHDDVWHLQADNPNAEAFQPADLSYAGDVVAVSLRENSLLSASCSA